MRSRARVGRRSLPERRRGRRLGRPGWEFADLGGRHHLGGGSHGSLVEGDSLVPVLDGRPRRPGSAHRRRRRPGDPRALRGAAYRGTRSTGRRDGHADVDERRARMVERQLRRRGIADERVLAAMGASRARLSFREPIARPRLRRRRPPDRRRTRRSRSRTSSPRCASCSMLDGTEHVLDVGTGSGYAAAVLDELAASVVSVERHRRRSPSALGARSRSGARRRRGTRRRRLARSARPRAVRRDRGRRRDARRAAGALRRSSPSAGGWCSRSGRREVSSVSSLVERTPERAGERASHAGCPLRPLRRRRRASATDTSGRVRPPLPSPAAWTRATAPGTGITAPGAGRRSARAGARTGSSSSSSASSARRDTSSTCRLHAAPARARPPLPPAAIGSFLVAVTNNYLWNRLWTFRGQRGHVVLPGSALPRRLDARARREPRRPAPARAGRPRRGASPRRSRSSSSRRSTSSATSCGRSASGADRVRAALAALAVARPGDGRHRAAATVPAPLRDRPGRADPPFAPPAEPRLTEDAGGATLPRPRPRSQRWLERYPPEPHDRRVLRRGRRGAGRCTSGRERPGEIARGVVDDADGRVTEAWTGPQVAWQMARGRPGAFGGKTLTSWPVWLGLSAIFLLGLVDLRRPLSMRNARPARAPLVRRVARVLQPRRGVSRARRSPCRRSSTSLVRTAWIGFRRGVAGRADAAALAGVAPRGGDALPRRVPGRPERRAPANRDRRRVRRGDRRRSHPRRAGAVRRDARRRRPGVCAAADPTAAIRERIQADGRCESTNPRGDTYGPVAYLAYVPAVLAFGWERPVGRRSRPPMPRRSLSTSSSLLGLVLVGRRLGGARLAVDTRLRRGPRIRSRPTRSSRTRTTR